MIHLLRRAAFLFFLPFGTVMPAAPLPDPPDAPCSEKNLASRTERFKQLRRMLKEGTEAERSALRVWGSEYHKLLSDLGDQLARCRVSQNEMIRLLGEPDQKFSAGQRHEGQEVPPGETHFAYDWRGRHDRLYLVVRDRRVVEARWWFAGE